MEFSQALTLVSSYQLENSNIYTERVTSQSPDCTCELYLQGNFTYFPGTSKLQTYLYQCNNRIISGCSTSGSCTCFYTTNVVSDIQWNEYNGDTCGSWSVVDDGVVLDTLNRFVPQLSGDNIPPPPPADSESSSSLNYPLLDVGVNFLFLLFALLMFCIVVCLLCRSNNKKNKSEKNRIVYKVYSPQSTGDGSSSQQYV